MFNYEYHAPLTEEQKQEITMWASLKGYPDEVVPQLIEVIATREERLTRDLKDVRIGNAGSQYMTGDYADLVKQERIVFSQLRQALATTEAGQQALAAIPPEQDDGETTIPLITFRPKSD